MSALNRISNIMMPAGTAANKTPTETSIVSSLSVSEFNGQQNAYSFFSPWALSILPVMLLYINLFFLIPVMP